MTSKQSMIAWPLAAAVLALPALFIYNLWRASSPKPQQALVKPALAPRPFPPALGAPYTPSAAGKEGRPLPAAPMVAAAPPPVAGQPLPPASSQGYNPGTDRDPTLSMGDRQKLEEEARKAREESLRRRNPAAGTVRRRPRRAKPIEKRIVLMAIVSTSENTRAIVNNEIVRPGDRVLGARVVRILSDRVIFEYKGRRFVERISE